MSRTTFARRLTRSPAPGLYVSGVDRPDEANTPTTGPGNRYFHGNKP